MHESVTDTSLEGPNDPRAPVTRQASSSARPVDLDSCNVEFIVSVSSRREHGGQGCEGSGRSRVPGDFPLLRPHSRVRLGGPTVVPARPGKRNPVPPQPRAPWEARLPDSTTPTHSDLGEQKKKASASRRLQWSVLGLQEAVVSNFSSPAPTPRVSNFGSAGAQICLPLDSTLISAPRPLAVVCNVRATFSRLRPARRPTLSAWAQLARGNLASRLHPGRGRSAPMTRGRGVGISRARNVASKACERRRGALSRDGQEEGQGGTPEPGTQSTETALGLSSSQIRGWREPKKRSEEAVEAGSAALLEAGSLLWQWRTRPPIKGRGQEVGAPALEGSDQAPAGSSRRSGPRPGSIVQKGASSRPLRPLEGKLSQRQA
ncbi:hypothetical protein R6Z07F_012390 [Ovis aries]